MYVNEHDTYSHGLSQFGSFKQKQNQFVESHMVSLWSAIKLNNRFTATDTTATAKKNVNSHFSLLNCICSEGFKFLFLCLLFFPKSSKSAVESNNAIYVSFSIISKLLLLNVHQVKKKRSVRNQIIS